MKKIENLSLDSFSPICVLGKGSYAHVLLVEAEGVPCHNETTKNFALKMIDKTDIEFRKMEDSVFRERDILVRLRESPFVTSLLASFQGDQEANFLLEFCPGGDLFERLSVQGPFKETHARFYVGQIALALHHIHKHGVVFRDLKPENILIDAQGYLKLADFGCSTTELTGLSGLVGTPEYMAPEMVRDYREKSGYDFRVDWWALGCFMFEALSGRAPFFSKNRKNLYEMIEKKRPEFLTKMSKDAKNLLTNLLHKSPEKRFKFEDIKNHAWFKGFDWELLEKRKMKAPWVPEIEEDFGIKNFNKKFVEMDFDGINCGMSEGLWLEDFYFESPEVEWIRRDYSTPKSEVDYEEFASEEDTDDEEELGRCGSFSDFDELEWNQQCWD